jgi:hypothetical protein
MADDAFIVRLDKSDWNPGIGGWRCPALKIPGATISKVYVTGKPIDASFYQVTSDEIIRWIPDNPPPQISVLISLTKSLSLQSETDFWKKLTVVVPIITALISGIVTYLTAPSKTVPGPLAHLLNISVYPIDLGSRRVFPPPIITINGKSQNYPLNYSITSDASAIVDVTDAINFTQDVKSLSERQRQVLQTVVDGSNALLPDLQRVPQLLDRNCSGGSNGVPAATNPAVQAATTKAISGISGFRASATAVLATPLPRP